MIKTCAYELIGGILKAVEYIKYSNGKRIKRIYGPDGVPEEIIDLTVQTQSDVALKLMKTSPV